MSDTNINVKLTQYERPEHIFPTLNATQIARISAHGKKRTVQAGEVLVEPGDNNFPFFLVILGAMEILRPTCEGEDPVVVHQAGQFSGEVGILSGRRSMVRARMREAGEVIEVDRSGLQELIETDSELSEILMRAFILRRVEFIAHGWGDAVLLGTNNSSGTLRIKEFLTRNGYPHAYIDLEGESKVQELLDHFQVTAADVPIVICRGKNVLRNPTNQQVADCLGFNEGIDLTKVRDVGGVAMLFFSIAFWDARVLDGAFPLDAQSSCASHRRGQRLAQTDRGVRLSGNLDGRAFDSAASAATPTLPQRLRPTAGKDAA